MTFFAKLLAFIVLIWVPGVFSLNAQHEGDIWVTGYKTSTIVDPEFGFAFWNFHQNKPVIEYDLQMIGELSETTASIADTSRILFMTNGMEVFETSGQRILDTIAYLDGGENWMSYFSDLDNLPNGFPKMQTAAILPVPNHPGEYSIIHYHGLLHNDLLFFAVASILETRIRRHLDGTWEVLYQDKVILQKYDQPFNLKPEEFFSQGTWHACKHANGRDWWILIHDFEGTLYYRLLLDPKGLRLVGTQEIDEQLNYAQNAWFSPDGTKYAKYLSLTFERNDLYLYDFDRCTGLLSNQIILPIEGTAMALQGASFSPDSRYLFVGQDGFSILQYDTWADDLKASEVLVDTNDGYIEPNWFPTTFGPMMPGPDGRIYMFPWSGSSRAVHVIDRPNERGKAAKLLQHHITLQTSNGRSVQNFANFRLGPLDGSPCDTLGLDNHPQARWRHEIENADPLEIRFTDLSFFRPEEWFWDFGDGTFSSEVHPIHTYPEPGLYYACLIVSNEYSSDTSCQWIEIETVSIGDEAEKIEKTEEKYLVHPNPFSDYLDITPVDDSFSYHNPEVTITDIHGRTVAHLEMTCPCRLKLSSLAEGVYFYFLRESGKVVGSGKVLKASGF
jgi:hypothetical protein